MPITMRHFINVLYAKTDRFHIPTIWNMVLVSGIAKVAFLEDFGDRISAFSLTLNVEP